MLLSLRSIVVPERKLINLLPCSWIASGGEQLLLLLVVVDPALLGSLLDRAVNSVIVLRILCVLWRSFGVDEGWDDVGQIPDEQRTEGQYLEC